jgi:hypothetical protein
MRTVPIGVPVRIKYQSQERERSPVVALATLSIKTGMVSGAVIDPSGTVRA